MRPSEVRAHVLSDHEELRGRLERLERLARSSLDGARDLTLALRQEAEGLLDRLAIHMSWEDRYLEPILREADGWGDVRSARFADEHREQRELLEFSLRQLHDARRPCAVLASNLLDLIALLRDDMEEEEKVFLDERVLRDDPVAIDLLTS